MATLRLLVCSDERGYIHTLYGTTGRCACRCVSPGCKTCVQLNVNKEKRCGYGYTVGWAFPKYQKSVERECSSSSSPVSRTLGLARRDNRMPLAAAARSRARWAAARTLRFTALSNIRISAPTTLAPWLCPPRITQRSPLRSQELLELLPRLVALGGARRPRVGAKLLGPRLQQVEELVHLALERRVGGAGLARCCVRCLWPLDCCSLEEASLPYRGIAKRCRSRPYT